MKTELLLVTLCLLAFPAGAADNQPLAGAEAAAGAAIRAQWENLGALRQGQHVQVVQMDLKSSTGRFIDVSDEAIRIRVRKDEQSIARSDVFRVSATTASGRVRNVVIGLALGAGLGAAAGAGVIHATNGSDFTGPIVGATTALGGGIGAGIGAAMPGYSTIYRAPKRVKPTDAPPLNR